MIKEDNVVLGNVSHYDPIEGGNNIILGSNSSSGAYSNCVLIGDNLTAVEDNSFIIGSAVHGAVETEIIKEAIDFFKEGIRMLVENAGAKL